MGKQEGRAGLGLWDRLVLLVAWVVTCGLVYLLGIYVGKGMQERLVGHEERVVRLPVTTAPSRESLQPKAEKELTFYDTLVQEKEPVRPAAGAPEPPAPPATTKAPAARPATPLPAASTAPASARPTPPAPAVIPATARPTPPPPTPSAAPARTPPPPAPVAARPPSPAAPLPAPGAMGREAVSAVPAATPPPASEAPAARGGGGNWTVLANPTRSHDEAERLARQLRSRGYAASVVRVMRAGDTWYRVAVGRFASAEQATEMMQRLREREGVAHVFVASE